MDNMKLVSFAKTDIQRAYNLEPVAELTPKVYNGKEGYEIFIKERTIFLTLSEIQALRDCLNEMVF